MTRALEPDAPAAADARRSSSSARVTRWHVVALGVIVALSLAYRLYVSSECSLWLDEASTARDIHAPWPALLRGPEREHPPLMFWIVRLATAILGPGDTAVRSVSLLFGCVLLVAVYLLCLELGFGATRALVPPAWLALTPFFIRYATEARQYAIVGAFTTLAAVYAVRLLRGPLQTSALIGFAGCSVAAGATQFFALPYALALWGAVAVGTVRRWRFRALPSRERAVVAGVLGGAALLFGVLGADIVALMHFYATHALHGSAHHHLPAWAVWRQFSFLMRPAWDPSHEAMIAGLGLLFVAARCRSFGGLLPLALAFAPVAVAHYLLSGGHMLTPRYLWPSFVFYQLGEAAAAIALIGLFELGVARAAALLGAGAFARPLARVRSLGWLALLVPLHARLGEFPNGFGAGGPVNWRGLQAYFHGERANDTALVVYVGYAGVRVMGTQYPVPRLMALEDFAPIPGISRYLIAEFGRGDAEHQRTFATLLKRHFGLSLKEWRRLRPVRLPGDRFQGPAHARLVTWEPNAARDHDVPESAPSEAPAEASDESTGTSDDAE